MLPQPFVSQKEENFVFHDRSAKRGAEIVALEGCLRVGGSGTSQPGIEEVPRIQRVVAKKLKQLAVILVSSRPSGEIYDGARISSVFRGKRRIVDLIFRKRVDGRLKGDLILHNVVQVDAVHKPIGRIFALSRGVDPKRALAPERRGKKSVGGRRHGPGCQ